MSGSTTHGGVMTTTGWRVAWQTPVRVSVSPDHSSLDRISFTATASATATATATSGTGGATSGTDIVQFSLGLDARLTVVTGGGPITVVGRDATGHVVGGVLQVIHEPSPVAQEPGESAPAEAAPGQTRAPDADAAEEDAAEPDASQADRSDSDAPGSGSSDADAPLPSRELVAALQPDLDETILTPVGIAEPSDEGASEPAADLDATVIGVGASDEPDHDDTRSEPRPAPRILRVEITDADGPRTFTLDGAVYVGRAPRVPAERASEPGGLAVVRSTTPHVSSTHLLLRAEHGQVLVRDLWSTNGTVLTPAHGTAYRLEPGETLPVASGSTLMLADDVRIEALSDEPGSDEPAARAEEHSRAQ